MHNFARYLNKILSLVHGIICRMPKLLPNIPPKCRTMSRFSSQTKVILPQIALH